MDNVRIGVSACLLGRPVRFDGGHKQDRFLMHGLAPLAELVPVCPEVEIGLGVPRETLRLVRIGRSASDDTRLVAPRSGADHTARMRAYAQARVAELKEQDLDGYVLKRASPSCGMERVRVYDSADGKHAEKDGVGLFAEALLRAWPLLPVEEEGRLNDDRLRENFFERVFAYRRLKNLFSGDWTVGQLVSFHSREKLLLLAHEPEAYRELGRLVAGAKRLPRGEVEENYCRRYMQALGRRATVGRNYNVLEHMTGWLRGHIDPDERLELGTVLDDYRRGLVPLAVPLTLLRHHVRRHDVGYLAAQQYLQPHPKELRLHSVL